MPEQKNIKFNYSIHRQLSVMRIYFAYDADLVEMVKQFEGMLWSQTIYYFRNRKQVWIENSKGNKDRYSLLNANLLNNLRECFKAYWPLYWLFEGNFPAKPYSATSITNILSKVCRLTGIKQWVTPHLQRHSFATHLLEQGVDLRYNQELLGHSSTKTNEIYPHVSTKDIELIRNPIDDILGSDPWLLLIPHQFGMKRTTPYFGKSEINPIGI